MAAKNSYVGLVLASVCMFGAAYCAEALKPTVSLADIRPAVVLEQLIPTQFGGWKEVPSLRPVLPDPSVQKVIESAYTQTLARGYVNDKGQVVMLTVAYGKDQNSESTAAHRPEFCYTGQGFMVRDLGIHQAQLANHALTMRQLVGTNENYVEQISYWVTLDDKATLPGLGRKLAQLRFGLHGQIADGMLVRVSSAGRDPHAAELAHDAFIRDLEQQIPSAFRPRFFGS
jgi:EpsI family protein